MQRCKICYRKFKRLRFNTPRTIICGYCTTLLNSYHEPAINSYKEIGRLLRKGIHKKSQHCIDDPSSTPSEIAKQIQTLENFDDVYTRALPDWINRLVADSSNNSRMIKIIRAERRGLLHKKNPKGWGYRNNWIDISKTIRTLDNYRCVQCGKTNTELHVHHIVYVYNYGTHRKENLVTLCRACHEKEHGRSFDFGENLQNTDIPPLESRIIAIPTTEKEVLAKAKETKFINKAGKATVPMQHELPLWGEILKAPQSQIDELILDNKTTSDRSKSTILDQPSQIGEIKFTDIQQILVLPKQVRLRKTAFEKLTSRGSELPTDNKIIKKPPLPTDGITLENKATSDQVKSSILVDSSQNKSIRHMDNRHFQNDHMLRKSVSLRQKSPNKILLLFHFFITLLTIFIISLLIA